MLFGHARVSTAEQGHLTARYTTAIEQLGSAKLGVWPGGIYVLERIAADSSTSSSNSATGSP